MENIRISFKVDGQDVIFENVDSPFDKLHVIPNVGDEVAFDYVHSLKVHFRVTAVKHSIYSSGYDIIQNITVHGETI